ncbi:AraC family transcriptional regulator [Paracoccus sp. APAP_BH8]|uniref:AraC family transcriptional regulator n=1 Tax=Paracoccus pantotrophus TaxID=82367 RepID=A0A7H9BYS7_PARPN|nr:AraC family transcriptional regulator [Paracoccus pantotrophus]MDF3856399.1 AraC family transcriptional regulator [Paracoccus pantotrophus]QLH14971.1 AraC family transcriptional regulator [Paracoccus pantotrophus]RDD99783.1 AraC family transcriptional regulator [Paracoccus pantotrophus]RNI15559.1 AraC family transcriptional regulator [Paracoccus pantotrophus]WGR65386.1 AraC family transcriptional regulator [Paracoccus pantotrophus]
MKPAAMLPLPDERIYAPYKIGALVEILAEQGIPPSESLKGSGVDMDDLKDPFALTSMRQYMTVCLNALDLSQDPTTPFKLGARLRVSAYGMYGYALLSCLSLRDYFRLAIKYRRLATPPMAIEWSEYDELAVWSFPDIFVLNPSQDLRRFLLEQQFSLHVTHLQDVAGKTCPPLRASFSHPAPEHAGIYEQYLNCPCFFEQPRCELVYERAVLDQKPVMAHPLTSVLMQETCDRLIGQAKTSLGASGSVYRILMERPGEFPDMEAVADKLNMTSRTLRRRLEAEGTAFQAIADDVRSTLAQEYLATTKMSVFDIAMLLGFSDAAGFRKALKRWTGKGPREFRQ